MTNAQQILNAINEWKSAYAAYSAAPSIDGWGKVNDLHNQLVPTAKSLPISRDEYESLINGERTNDDDVIYRCESSWWNGDSQAVWAMAHFARRAALEIERGKYIAPTAAALGLELVTDSLPDEFREYHKGAEC